MRGLHFVLIGILGLSAGQAHGAAAPNLVRGFDGAIARPLPPVTLPEGVKVLHTESALGVPILLTAPRIPAPSPDLSVEEAAWFHLRENARLYRLADALPLLHVRAIHQRDQGPLIVSFAAEVFGVPLFRDELAIVMAQDRSLLGISGYLSPHLAAAGSAPPSFPLSSLDALALALADFSGSPASPPELEAEGVDDAGLEVFRLPAEDLDVRLGPVLYESADALIPGWYVELLGIGRAASHVIDAARGELLFRNDLVTEHAYRVWAGEDLEPFSPVGRHATPYPPGDREPGFPGTVPSVLLTLLNGPISTGDPWLAPTATVTTGNNVEAFADLHRPDGYTDGDVRASTTAPATFDRSYRLHAPPGADSTQIQASVTQLFYTTNWIHDFLYDAGFDESARNAQVDNYRRGGAGRDRLIAAAQHYAVPSNALMMTPSDGASPWMLVGNFAVPGVVRDGALDADIVIHEYGHLLTNRLIGNGNGLNTLQSRGLGEGWSDFLALLVKVRAEDALQQGNGSYEGVYPVSTFAIADAYFGIRRYPYSTSFAVNPLSFQHIQYGVPLPVGVPVLDRGVSNAETHNTGEVWASMLWEAYAALLNDRDRLDFAQARERMLGILVASLKITPRNPTFIEARDALLLAAAGFDGIDQELILAAFARRGAGLGAVAPGRGADGNLGVRESYLGAARAEIQTATIEETLGFCDGDGVVDAGERGVVRVKVVNGASVPAIDVEVRASSRTPGVTLDDGGRAVIASIAPLQTATAFIGFELGPVAGITPLEIDVSLRGDDADPPRVHQAWALANYDRLTFNEAAYASAPLRCSLDPWDPAVSPGLCRIVPDRGLCIQGPAASWIMVDPVVEEGSLVRLEGGVTLAPDPNLTFSWSNSDVWVDDPTAPLTSFLAPQVRRDTFIELRLLIMGDGIGRIASTKVLLKNVNQPPIVSARSGSTRIDERLSVLLYGEASDPDGDPVEAHWLQVAGPTAVIEHPERLTTRAIAPDVDEDTVITFALVASDGDLESRALVDLLVRSIDPPPPEPEPELPEEVEDPDAPAAKAKNGKGGVGCSSAATGGTLGIAALLWAATLRRRGRLRAP